MSKGKLRIERDGPVGRLVLDNPERRNAISADMWQAIPPAMAAFNADASIRCIVIRGEGTQAFAAGADISEFEKNRSSEGDVKEYEAATSAAHQAIESSSKPVIALIHGFCVGGGLVWRCRAICVTPMRRAVSRFRPRASGWVMACTAPTGW